MNTNRRILIAALPLCAAAISSLANAATIDLIDIATFGHYQQTFNPSGYTYQRELELGSPDVYHLSDGSTWASGAGSFYSFAPTVQSVQQDANIITYSLSTPSNGVIWDYTDYNSGNHSSKGTLSLHGDALLLTAVEGSATAVLSGLLEVTSNTYSNYSDYRYNFFTANVGDVVPFEINFTLYGGSVWNTSLFNNAFTYNLEGQIDLASPVPIPGALWLFASGLLPLLRIRTSKS